MTLIRIRLKHSLKEGEEIHAVLPATLEEVYASFAREDVEKLVASLDVTEVDDHDRSP